MKGMRDALMAELMEIDELLNAATMNVDSQMFVNDLSELRKDCRGLVDVIKGIEEDIEADLHDDDYRQLEEQCQAFFDEIKRLRAESYPFLSKRQRTDLD